MPKPSPTTISLIESSAVFGQQVSFKVEPSNKVKNRAKLWVANKAVQNGVIVSAEYLPIEWPSPDSEFGIAGPFTLGPTPGWLSGAADCVAYVWEFPASESALRGAIFMYTVGA